MGWVRTPKRLYPIEEAEEEIEKLGQEAELHIGRPTKSPHMTHVPTCGDSGK